MFGWGHLSAPPRSPAQCHVSPLRCARSPNTRCCCCKCPPCCSGAVRAASRLPTNRNRSSLSGSRSSPAKQEQPVVSFAKIDGLGTRTRELGQNCSPGAIPDRHECQSENREQIENAKEGRGRKAIEQERKTQDRRIEESSWCLVDEREARCLEREKIEPVDPPENPDGTRLRAGRPRHASPEHCARPGQRTGSSNSPFTSGSCHSPVPQSTR